MMQDVLPHNKIKDSNSFSVAASPPHNTSLQTKDTSQ